MVVMANNTNNNIMTKTIWTAVGEAKTVLMSKIHNQTIWLTSITLVHRRWWLSKKALQINSTNNNKKKMTFNFHNFQLNSVRLKPKSRDHNFKENNWSKFYKFSLSNCSNSPLSISKRNKSSFPTWKSCKVIWGKFSSNLYWLC